MTTPPKDIRRIKKDYYEQFFYAYKFDNLYEMDQVEKHNLSKLLQEALGPNVFTGEFYQILMEEMIPILCHLSQRTETVGKDFLNYSMRPALP